MHRQDAYAPSDVHLLVAPEYAYLSTILVCNFNFFFPTKHTKITKDFCFPLRLTETVRPTDFGSE